MNGNPKQRYQVMNIISFQMIRKKMDEILGQVKGIIPSIYLAGMVLSLAFQRGKKINKHSIHIYGRK